MADFTLTFVEGLINEYYGGADLEESEIIGDDGKCKPKFIELIRDFVIDHIIERSPKEMDTTRIRELVQEMGFGFELFDQKRDDEIKFYHKTTNGATKYLNKMIKPKVEDDEDELVRVRIWIDTSYLVTRALKSNADGNLDFLFLKDDEETIVFTPSKKTPQINVRVSDISAMTGTMHTANMENANSRSLNTPLLASQGRTNATFTTIPSTVFPNNNTTTGNNVGGVLNKNNNAINGVGTPISTSTNTTTTMSTTMNNTNTSKVFQPHLLPLEVN